MAIATPRRLLTVTALLCSQCTPPALLPVVERDQFAGGEVLALHLPELRYDSRTADKWLYTVDLVHAPKADGVVVRAQIRKVMEHTLPLMCTKWDWAINGSPLAASGPRYEADPAGTETLTLQIPADGLRALAAARSAAYRLCESEVTLDERELAGLRDFGAKALARLRGGAPAAASGAASP